MKRIISTLFGLALLCMFAEAQAVPGTVAFTGRLSTSNGPVAGNVSLTFNLFSTATGGSSVWTETRSIDAVAGLVYVDLGATSTLDEMDFGNGPLFLQITVSGETLMPRFPIQSVPYAIRARAANSADTLGTLSPGDVALSTHNHDAAYAAIGHNHNGVYAALSHSHDAANINAGTLSTDRYSAAADLGAEGLLNNDAAGDIITRGQGDGRWAALTHAHAATDITSGTLDNLRFSAQSDLSAEGFLTGGQSTDLLMFSDGDARYSLGTHTHPAGSSPTFSVIPTTCLGNIPFTATYTKIANLGSFTKATAGSTVVATFNGRVAVITSMTGTGALFELRLDDVAATSRARASFKSSEVGSDGKTVSLKGVWTGLAAGSHTFSMWVAASGSSTGSGAMVDPGCWSADTIVVEEHP